MTDADERIEGFLRDVLSLEGRTEAEVAECVRFLVVQREVNFATLNRKNAKRTSLLSYVACCAAGASSKKWCGTTRERGSKRTCK